MINKIGLLEEISHHLNLDNGRSSWLVFIVSIHGQTRFRCCFKSTMATDQNIKNKTLASEIDTAYGRYMVDWHVSPRKYLFLQLQGNFFIDDRIFFGRLRPADIQYCHSWKLKTAGSWNYWNFSKFFLLYQW